MIKFPVAPARIFVARAPIFVAPAPIFVAPAKAGAHLRETWIPAFAGMTEHALMSESRQ